MAETPSFSSWEPTWNHYAQLVSNVAYALNPEATEADRNTRITASAAAGLLDESNVDPLAALLVGLLHNRSAADRLVAAQSLVQSGIHSERAAGATGAPRLQKATPAFDRQTNSGTPPTFEPIRAHAIALWEQRGPIHRPSQTPAELAGSATNRATDRKAKQVAERQAAATAEIERKESEQRSLDLATDRTRRRRRTAAGVLGFVITGVFVGRILSPRLREHFRHDASPPLLTVKDLPKQWELTFAAAHLPASVLNSTAVFQRFDSFDNKQTVLVTTLREDRRFADPSLGTPRIDPANLASATMKSQPEAVASDSFPVHTPADAPVMMEWKQPLVPFVMNQSATVVYIEAYGMPSSDVRSLGRSLKARAKLLENGWSTPKGFSEQIVVPQRQASEGIQSLLMFRSTLDGKTRVVVQVRRAGEEALEIGDLHDPRGTASLPSGRVVTFNREFRHNYSWKESSYEFSVTVWRSDIETLGSVGSTQQTRNDFSRLEPLPDRHLDGILDLLDRIRLGNDEQWRSLTAGYQASLNRLPSLRIMHIGSNEIETRGIDLRAKGGGRMGTEPTVLCAYSVCAPIYRSSNGTTKEADLLIDDHWWHFRQIATDKTVPKYFTSPAVDSFKTGEADFDQTHKWWGIDFGPTVTAARHSEEASLLLRPLPR
jgi:hypothetical protein